MKSKKKKKKVSYRLRKIREFYARRDSRRDRQLNDARAIILEMGLIPDDTPLPIPSPNRR